MDLIENENGQLMHSALVYQIKKSRGINWTPNEKEYLIQLCRHRIGVIEDKKSDLVTLSKKACAWKFIHNKFSARFGRKRTPIRIKEQWKRMKIAARAELRDRGVKPEVGAQPLDPNIPTNKYYGETVDIIAKVQELLFSKNLEEEKDKTNEVDDEANDIQFDEAIEIKAEPIEEFDMSGSCGNGSFSSDNSIHLVNGEMFIRDDHYKYNDTPPLSHIPQLPVECSGSSFKAASQVERNPIRQKTLTPHERHIFDASIRERMRPCLNQDLRSGTFLNKSDEANMQNVSCFGFSEIVEKKLLEYARIEHERKMSNMEEEHNLQMQILSLQRDAAAVKLKKANLKLTACNSSFS